MMSLYRKIGYAFLAFAILAPLVILFKTPSQMVDWGAMSWSVFAGSAVFGVLGWGLWTWMADVLKVLREQS